MFDNHTRRISALQEIYEDLVDLASFGLAPSPESTGETIRVVDATTGGICFELDGSAFPMSGRHADLSPSGRFVVVVMDDTLSIYRLPNSCAPRRSARSANSSKGKNQSEMCSCSFSAAPFRPWF